jgi:heme-degrading monooxygenase HmoA
MFAVIRERASDSVGKEQAQEFNRFKAKQPGYSGAIDVQTEDGRTMIITLWETEEQHQAAHSTLSAEGRRLNGPEWAGPPRVVSQGHVVYNDLSKP